MKALDIGLALGAALIKQCRAQALGTWAPDTVIIVLVCVTDDERAWKGYIRSD